MILLVIKAVWNSFTNKNVVRECNHQKVFYKNQTYNAILLVIVVSLEGHSRIYESMYPRMDKVKFVKDSLQKFRGDMICLNTNFLSTIIPQILVCPFY